jgi:hypothetical protein
LLILEVLTELQMKFLFIHVKSHQDDETPMANLSLDSRLNVEADRLVTKYMQEDLVRRPPTVNLFSSAKVQFLIKDVSVTRKIPQAIRFAAGSDPIKEYLMERNVWTAQTLSKIDWDAHDASHSYHRSQRCYLVKLCHRHLPLGHTLHRRNTKYSPTCPGCQEAPEIQNHFFQCTALSRIEWRISLLTNIRTQLKRTRTNDHLQATIVDCIDKAILGCAIPITEPFQTTLESHARISWLGLLRGYWSTQWQQEYAQTYEEPEEETRKEKNK